MKVSLLCKELIFFALLFTYIVVILSFFKKTYFWMDFRAHFINIFLHYYYFSYT